MNDTVTHRRIAGIAFPLVASNITVPLVGLVDAGVVGQMPNSAALTGAVGLGASIISLLLFLFGFLRMGTVGLTSQAFGAGNSQEVSSILFRAIGLGVGFGLILLVLQGPAFWLAFKLSPASVHVESYTWTYLCIRIWSAPAAIALYGITGWLIGQERTRSVFLLLSIINGINILLDLVFVLGLCWAIEGVAAATLIAEWVGLFVGLWLCREAFLCDVSFQHIFDKTRLGAMAVVNADIMIRSLLLLIGVASFAFVGADLGDATLAANVVLQQFVWMSGHAMDGFAFAAEALVGRFFGAKQKDKVKEVALKTSMWGAGICISMALGTYLFGPNVIDILTKDPVVQAEARVYLWWMVVTPIVACPAWMLDGIFIGATRSADMRNMMIVSFILYLIVLVFSVPILGNTGLWLAFTLFYIFRGATLAVRLPVLLENAGR